MKSGAATPETSVFRGAKLVTREPEYRDFASFNYGEWSCDTRDLCVLKCEASDQGTRERDPASCNYGEWSSDPRDLCV